MEKVICWWSGGVTSAVACRIAIDTYGLDNCRFLFIDTMNEHDDTYRFKNDCEKWYGCKIETIRNKRYNSIQDVWYEHLSLNVAKGAKCSSELKRIPRIEFQRKNKYRYQIFGFDCDEVNRAINMKKNNAVAKPIFPLLLFALSKKDCIEIIEKEGIQIPETYKLGFTNNNCFKTGCIQGGIGYWQKIKRDFPEKFNTMADIEHDLTNLKGQPVTISKDQSKSAKESGQFKVFLKPHPDYPFYKSIDDFQGIEPENLMECNGFCGIQTTLFSQV